MIPALYARIAMWILQAAYNGEAAGPAGVAPCSCWQQIHAGPAGLQQAHFIVLHPKKRCLVQKNACKSHCRPAAIAKSRSASALPLITSRGRFGPALLHKAATTLHTATAPCPALCLMAIPLKPAAYSTWVVEGPRTPICYSVKNRTVDLRVMIYLAWGFIFLNWWVTISQRTTLLALPLGSAASADACCSRVKGTAGSRACRFGLGKAPQMAVCS